jgi:predicted Zn-dependent peptidase
MKTINFLFILLFSIILTSNAQVDRSKPPKAGPAPKINLSEYQKFELANGLKVFVVENHKLPRVALSLVIDRDPVLEAEFAGFVSAAGDLLRGGTKNRTKDQLDEEIDFIGAAFSTSPNNIFAMSLKEHQNKLMELVSDVATNSIFNQEELDKIKKRMQSDLAASKDDPGSIVSNVRKALIYGKNHPYGEIMTEESVEKITLEKTKEYYNSYFRPNAAYLAVVGDITVDEVKPLIEKYFGKWQRKEIPVNNYDVPKPPYENQVALVDRANSVQSTINVTYPVELKPNDPDVLKTTVMNTILGGGNFRLFNNLREKRGFTYGAYSTLSKDEVIGYFNAFADVRNEVTDSSITEILFEMKKMKDEPVPADELELAKNFITGNFAMSLEEPQTIANFAINIERYKLPEDYYKNYLKNISLVSVDDIKTVSDKYLKPDKSYIVVVGNADEIKGDLEKFGPLNFYDIYGNELDENRMKIPDGLTADKVIEDYIAAIGGRENMEKVTDRKTTMKGSMQGIDFAITAYQKAPDKLYQEINASGMEQKVIFDGSKGVMTAAGNKINITGNELEKLKYESTLGLLLNLNDYGVKSDLKSVEEVEGKETYKIEMTLPSGSKWTQFYEIESGLKVKEIKPVATPQGSFNQETYYSDYREVNGVKYPFEIRQSIGPQQMEFTVESIEINSGISDRNFEIKE